MSLAVYIQKKKNNNNNLENLWNQGIRAFNRNIKSTLYYMRLSNQLTYSMLNRDVNITHYASALSNLQ